MSNKLVEEYEKVHKKVVTDEQVISAVEEANKQKPVKTSFKSGIVVEGMDDVAVRFSKCCSPLPGDEIIGFVTRGRGVSIHRTDCVNVINLPDIDRARLIEAIWAKQGKDDNEKYTAEIIIYAENRVGILLMFQRYLQKRI